MAEQQAEGEAQEASPVHLQGPVVCQALGTRPHHVCAALPPAGPELLSWWSVKLKQGTFGQDSWFER